MDFMEGSPKFDGKEVMDVVVDRLTKHIHFLGMANPYCHIGQYQVADLVYQGHNTICVHMFRTKQTNYIGVHC